VLSRDLLQDQGDNDLSRPQHRPHSTTKTKIQGDFKAIREVAREQTDLSKEELDEALDAKKMAGA